MNVCMFLVFALINCLEGLNKQPELEMKKNIIRCVKYDKNKIVCVLVALTFNATISWPVQNHQNSNFFSKNEIMVYKL